MSGKLGKYTLLRTLGQGAYSKVKEAIDENGNRYAIKIHRADKFNNKTLIEVIENEAQAISKLNHPRIVNIKGYSSKEVVESKKGAYDAICVIVEEIAENGELFYFVKNSGYFTEKIARHFFHQIMDGLEYVHQSGYAHRDIKPDNILLDADFNVKIADFGYAGPIRGRDNSGKLTTKLGTEPYMAPEIHEGKKYSGEAVDLFATAIVLFIMVAGTPPFNKASIDDFFYKLVYNQRWDMFWKYHCKSKPSGANFFSDEFKHLIQLMLAYQPESRLTMADLKTHPWVIAQLPTYEEVVMEFKQRKALNDEVQAQDRLKKQAQKGTGARYRGNGGDDEAEEEKTAFELSKDITLYEKTNNKNTVFFLPENPDDIMNTLEQFLMKKQEETNVTYEMDENTYKINFNFEDQELQAVAKITRVEGKELFAVEFSRKSGDYWEYLTLIDKLQKKIEFGMGYREVDPDEEEAQEQANLEDDS